MIVDIWVLVSMMDFMPGKDEHETGIFYGKSGATSWRYVHVNVMSHININKFKMVEQRLCSWYWHVFLDKGLRPKYWNRVELSYVFNIVPYGI